MYIEEKIIEPLQESINTVRREHLKFSKVPEFEGNILGEEVKVIYLFIYLFIYLTLFIHG